MLAEIERRVLLAGDTPGTVLRSILAAGAQPGATVLMVEARYKPVTGLVSTDDVLARSLGAYTLGTGLDLNSPTGQGESLYFRASGAPYSGGERSFFAQDPRNRALAVGLTRQQRPTSLERAMARGRAYGVGLRLAAAPGLGFTNAAASVELGRAERADGLPDDTGLTLHF